MKRILAILIFVAPVVVGCQRDDEIVLEKKFGACKMEALRSIPGDQDIGRTNRTQPNGDESIVIDPEFRGPGQDIGRTDRTRSDYVASCMQAAGFREVPTCLTSTNLMSWDDPVLCFDDGSGLVATKYQEPDRWLFWQWQWIKWRIASLLR